MVSDRNNKSKMRIIVSVSTACYKFFFKILLQTPRVFGRHGEQCRAATEEKTYC